MKKGLWIGLGLIFGVPALLVLAVVVAWTVALLGSGPELEVGPDTTVFEGPLRDDGTVDYAAAWNARYSEGVTPENNAFAAIAPLMMPEVWTHEPQHRARVFELLGIELPPEDAVYFETFNDYAQRRAEAEDAGPWAEFADQNDDEADEDDEAGDGEHADRPPRWEVEWEQASEGPWSREQLPLVAEWLDDHDAMLDRVVEAAHRERFWFPYVAGNSEDDLVLGILAPHLLEIRGIVQGLHHRALHRLHQEDVDGAIVDVLAVRRLGAHMVDAATVFEQLVGLALAGMAAEAITHITASEHLTAEQARHMQAEWSATVRRPRVDFAIDVDARGSMLDFLQRPDAADRMGERGADVPTGLPRGVFDRNRALRRANDWFDRMVDAAAAPTPAERTAEFDAIKQDLDVVEHRATRPGVWLSVAFARTSVITDSITDLLVAILAPALDRAVAAAERTDVGDTLAHVSLGVAGYRAQHGEYPPSLDALVPDWLDEVPTDSFDPQQRPVRYLLEDDRVAIYSVGPNGEDNGGYRAERRADGDILLDWPRP